MTLTKDRDQLCINTIRTLSMDAVQKASSGHPGTAMAMAPVVYTLWQRLLRFDPADPIWPNRDRFVLSIGHASMLLYSMLHLTGQQRHTPVALILSRQALPTLDRTKYAAASGLERGAYVLADASASRPDVVLLASGSEVAVCIRADERLTRERVTARVVSMPSWELFERQTQEYRDSVLPPSVTARVAVEQASTLGWSRYVGTAGETIGMKTFGASAPLKELQKKFGFTPEHVVAAAIDTLRKGAKT